jgi:hypothetical protein
MYCCEYRVIELRMLHHISFLTHSLERCASPQGGRNVSSKLIPIHL